jgi:hypothetical protein
MNSRLDPREAWSVAIAKATAFCHVTFEGGETANSFSSGERRGGYKK